MRKEFREIFRDRRTVMSVVIGPLVITPLLFFLMGLMINKQISKSRVENHRVGLVGVEAAPGMAARLGTIPNTTVKSVSLAEAEAQIRERALDAALAFPADADRQLNAGGTVAIQVMYDAAEQKSQGAAGRLRSRLTEMGQEIVTARLTARGLPDTLARPFKTTDAQIKSGGGAGSMVLSMMLPYILVVSAFGGAIYAAFDQVAGEKERGTLETLLVSPASRRDIVVGKFGAVVAVCLISAVLSIAGLVLAFSTRSKAMDWMSQGGFSLSPTAVGVVLLVMLPLSVLFAGLLLAISTFARNQKEAQTYIGPLFTIVLLPAMASMFMGSDVGLPVALVPILNTAIIIKQALSGSYNAAFIALAFGASVVYAAAALAVATRLFQKESVLLKA